LSCGVVNPITHTTAITAAIDTFELLMKFMSLSVFFRY